MSNKFYLTNSLPKAFNDSENERYFLMVQNGDENAKEALIEHNLRLIANIINKKFYSVDVIDKSELFSIGAFGLNKAVENFDITKGYKFSTYAGRVITNEILMTLRKIKHSKNDISLESIVHEDKNGEGLTLENMMASDDNLEESYINRELKEAVRKALEILTERERTVIELYYGFKGNLYNHKQIVEMLGISQSYVSRISSRAKRKIRQHLISQGLIESSEARIETAPVKEQITEEKVLAPIPLITEKNKKVDELLLEPGESLRKQPSLDNHLHKEEKGSLEMKKEEKVQENMKKVEKSRRKEKTLLSLFPSYSEIQIKDALEKLAKEEKEILLLRYPTNHQESKTLDYIAQKYDIKPGSMNYKLNSIIKKVNEALGGQTVEREKTIFEYFSHYSQEQVMKAISSLNDKGKKIIELKYGLNGNSVTSTKDIAKLYNTKSSTMSTRIYAIRKSIQVRLEKITVSVNTQEDSIELANSKLEQIKKSILENTFDEGNTIYNIGGIKIEIQKIETTCFIAGKDKKRNILDRVHSINKKCFVYVIRMTNSAKDLLSESILVQDIKTGKFYRFINKYEDGEYDISLLQYGELVCYDIVGVHVKRLKKAEDIIEPKPIVNIPKVEEAVPKELPKYTAQEIEQAESCFEIGIKLFKQRQLVKAQKSFLKALASGKTYTLQQTNYYLGRIEISKKKPIIAEKYLSTSLQYDDKDYYVLLELGKALSMQGKYEEASVYFNKCFKIKPRYTDHIVEQAKNLIMQNKYEEALKQYDKAISLKSNPYYIYLKKGELLYNLKRYDEAKKVLITCDKLMPAKKHHNKILGMIAYLEGDKERAKALFDELLKYDSKRKELAVPHIGFYFHGLGEKELAYEYYSKYPVFKNWFNITEGTVNEHIQKHMSNSENETMHSVFNFPVSVNLLNELIKDMDKTSIRPLYDMYQIHCENAGYMVIDEGRSEREDYITVLTLPFTKKVMQAYPDFKLPDVEITKSVKLEDLVNFGKVEDTAEANSNQAVEQVAEEDVTIITDKSQSVVATEFEKCRNPIRMFINMLSDPTEQVVLLLRLGYVRNRNYTEREISAFLNISEEEVKNIIGKTLSNLTSISSSLLKWTVSQDKAFSLTEPKQ